MSGAAISSAFVLHSSSPLLALSVSVRKEMKVETKAVEQLLQLIVSGEQKEAEDLVQKKPALLLCKGNVMDLSRREFKEITGFQYAVWALDWHMWRMLMKYLPKEIAALQLAELEEKGTLHGKHASWQNLIDALNTCHRNYSTWDGSEFFAYFIAHVGGAQLLLPVHVVNEYCHLQRPFSPCPDFKELTRTRLGSLYDGSRWLVAQDWHTGRYMYDADKGLGQKFAFVRGDFRSVFGAVGYGAGYIRRSNWKWEEGEKMILMDIAALQKLKAIREAQREALKAELIISPMVHDYLPSVLTQVVIGYLVEDDTAVSLPRL